ncbi:hypothetical protein [Paraburkholderia caribensis]|uniref:hypothetical protein n=1 Tax=Paraburkholderia caribensis TaxID=75105 RepID=UPI0034D2AAF7
MRKSRKDRQPAIVKGREVYEFTAPWPEWELKMSETERRVFNLSRFMSPGLEGVTREFNEVLYVLRTEYAPVGMEGRFYAAANYLRYLGTLPDIERPKNIAEISFTSLEQFVEGMCPTHGPRPFPHGYSKSSVIDYARLIRTSVRQAWQRGIVRGTRRPTITGNFQTTNDDNTKNKEDIYSEDERARVLKAIKSCLDAGRGDTYTQERMYLAACCLVIFIYLPANRADVLRLNEESLQRAESERPHDLVVLKKHRPRKKANRLPVEKQASEDVDEGIPIHRGTKLIRRVFEENEATNRTFRGKRGKVNPLFQCIVPGKGRRKEAIDETDTRARLNVPTMQRGIRDFEIKYALVADDGEPLRLTPRRLRKTYFNALPREDTIEEKSMVMNHTNTATSAEKYAAVSDDDHYRFHLGLKALTAAIDGRNSVIVVASKMSKVPLATIRRLAAGMLRTKAASCTDPANGKYAPKNGTPCGKTFTCFRCPNLAVVPEDLYRLASLAQRITVDLDSGFLQGKSRSYFALVRDIIRNDIFGEFEPRVVRLAEKRASKKLHPLWARPTLELAG